MDIKFAIKNGEIIERDKAVISIYNKAFFFDFAVYSNIKVVQGKPFLLGLEIEKLFESAKNIRIEHDFKKQDVLQWAKKLIAANNLKDSLIRLLLIGHEKETEPLLFLFPVPLTFYPAKFYTKGVKLVTFKGERHFPTIKSKDMLLSYIAYREAIKHDAIDALLMDRNNKITEGTRSSFFAIKGNTLIVPPRNKVLGGVTRKIILEIAKKTMNIEEKDLSLKNIADYDACFISGTTLNIMPVKQIDSMDLSKNDLKKIRTLQVLFKKYLKNHLEL